MKERSRSRWSFASWRPRSRKKAREARQAALAEKSSTDDIQVSYTADKAGDAEVRAAMTPPAERKAKKSTIPNFFKPWKWKRKKKPEGKEPISAYGNDATDPSAQPRMQKDSVPADQEATNEIGGQVTSEEDKLPYPSPTAMTTGRSEVKAPGGVTEVEINSSAGQDPPEPPAAGSPPPTSPDALPPPLPEKAGRLSPALPPKRNVSPALPPKEGTRAGAPAVPNHTGHSGDAGLSAGNQPTVRIGGVVGMRSHPVTIGHVGSAEYRGDASASGQCNGEVGHIPDSSEEEDSLSDYDNKENSRDSDSDTDEDCNTSLVARVKRNDSLAFHLRNRPSREALQERNILPQQSKDEKKQIMNAIGTKLVRRLSQRPTQEELQQRNIYKDEGSGQTEKEKIEEKKRILVRKLSFRPTVEELRQRNIIKFNEYVEVMEAFDYDRKAEKPWTKLTPQDKASIRKELNDFKSEEMSVHEESRKYTRFHRP